MAVATNKKIASNRPPKKAKILRKKSIPEHAMPKPSGMVANLLAASVLRFFLKRNKFSRLKGMASSTASPGKINIRPPSLMST